MSCDIKAHGVKAGDVWRSAAHVVHVIEPEAARMSSVMAGCESLEVPALVLYLEGMHAGKPPRRVWMGEGLWTLLVRP